MGYIQTAYSNKRYLRGVLSGTGSHSLCLIALSQELSLPATYSVGGPWILSHVEYDYVLVLICLVRFVFCDGLVLEVAVSETQS